MSGARGRWLLVALASAGACGSSSAPAREPVPVGNRATPIEPTPPVAAPPASRDALPAVVEARLAALEAAMAAMAGAIHATRGDCTVLASALSVTGATHGAASGFTEAELQALTPAQHAAVMGRLMEVTMPTLTLQMEALHQCPGVLGLGAGATTP